jgi:hypothetical protein
MKTFTVDLDEMLTVAAAVLDANGVLLAANPGFLRLLPAEFGNPVGARVARFFVQPGFAALAAQSDVDVGDGYRGQLTIGDQAGKTRTLRGHVWRRATEIRLLAGKCGFEAPGGPTSRDIAHRLAHRCWQSAQARAGFGNRDQPCATQWRLGLRDYGRYRSVQACQRCIRARRGR